MTRRLVLTYVALTLVAMALLAVPLGLTFAHREHDRLLFEIERDADAIASSVQSPMQHHQKLPSAPILTYARNAGGRVIVVDTSGRSVLDTDPTKLSTDFSSRPEIQAALHGNRVEGTRRSETLSTNLLYAAVPTNGDGKVIGAVRITYPTGTLDARVRRAWFQLATLCIAVLAAVALLAFLLARSMTRPIRRLEVATDRLAGGEFETRVDPTVGPPELRHLAETFNRMAARMTATLDSEKRFVADASHQLRTPLTALRLQLENLEHAPPDAQVRALDAAIAEVTRMARLIDALLALARGDADTASPQPVEVVHVVRERADAWRELLSSNNIALELDTIDHAIAMAARGAIEQLVDNLLDNALDASPPGSTITVRVIRDGAVELHVIDQGAGLSADEREHAFDRFWRGADAGPGGSGLGLAIVRRLAEASGGTARLDAAPLCGLDAVVALAPAQGVAPSDPILSLR